MQRPESGGQVLPTGDRPTPQQHRGDAAAENGPHHSGQDRRILLPAGGDHVHHEGRGVGAGDEEDHQQDQESDDQQVARRDVFQHLEQGVDVVDFVVRADEATRPVKLLPQRRPTHNREPQEGHQRRHGQHSRHEFPDGASLRDTGDEDSHER